MNKHLTMPVDKIHPNPHRDFSKNPLRQEQITAIVDSIGRTGFWDNVVVRPHPDKPGEYQLAYGHNRLEAVKRAGIEKVTLPIRDLSDWDLYCAMVDENETQGNITPAVAFENVQVGVGLLEAAFQGIGPEGTWKQFNRVLGRSCVEISTQLRGKHNGRFQQARNAFFRGEGVGRVFVKILLPNSRLNEHAISDVLNSLYGTARAESKIKQAEREEQEAADEEKGAETEQNTAKTEERRNKAEQKRQRAKKLRHEAVRIGEGSIEPDILLQLENTYQMRQFTAAIKVVKVPKAHHRDALDFIKQTGITAGKPMLEAIQMWWYKESGQESKDMDRAHKQQALNNFRRKTRNGDLGEFLLDIGDKARELNSLIIIALTATAYYENEAHAKRLSTTLLKIQDSIGRLILDLDPLHMKRAQDLNHENLTATYLPTQEEQE